MRRLLIVLTFVLGLVAVTWLLAALCLGQESEPERAYFSNRTLRVYCTVENTPAGLNTVDLWVTTNGGKEWNKSVDSKLACDEDGSLYFEFVVPGDGEYGLKTVAIDKVGNCENEPAPGEAPKLVAVVDSKPPALRLVNPKGGETLACGSELAIVWEFVDEHPGDRPVTTVEISRDGGSSWEVVGANEHARGAVTLVLPSQEISAFLVRVTAKDLAENQVQVELEKPVAVAQKTVAGQEPSGTAAQPPARSNNRVFNIDYEVDVGESGLKAVVLWFTEDDGKTWQFYGYDSDLASPMSFRAPKDGVFGFYIIAYSGADKSRPEPAAGTSPDKTTYVDSEPPRLVVTAPKAGASFAGGTDMEIFWVAQDDLLVEVPVSLFYREDETKPWNLMARSKDAIGRYTWNLPFLNTRKLSVRVCVEDIGKNVTECVVDGLTVDSKEIRPKILGVYPAAGTVPSGAGTDQGGTSAREPYVDEAAAREHFEKGKVLRAQQKWSDAAEQFELAVKNKPDFRDALNDLGCTLYKAGKYKEATEAFGKALALTPQDPELRYNMAAAHFGAGEHEKTAELLLPLLVDAAASSKVGPRAAELLWTISVEFYKAGNAKAREIWQRLSEIKTFSSPIIQKAKDMLAK